MASTRGSIIKICIHAGCRTRLPCKSSAMELRRTCSASTLSSSSRRLLIWIGTNHSQTAQSRTRQAGLCRPAPEKKNATSEETQKSSKSPAASNSSKRGPKGMMRLGARALELDLLSLCSSSFIIATGNRHFQTCKLTVWFASSLDASSCKIFALSAAPSPLMRS
jgi:hypothetical protein